MNLKERREHMTEAELRALGVPKEYLQQPLTFFTEVECAFLRMMVELYIESGREHCRSDAQIKEVLDDHQHSCGIPAYERAWIFRKLGLGDVWKRLTNSWVEEMNRKAKETK